MIMARSAGAGPTRSRTSAETASGFPGAAGLSVQASPLGVARACYYNLVDARWRGGCPRPLGLKGIEAIVFRTCQRRPARVVGVPASGGGAGAA
jgi:hypothetical protein